MNIDLLEPVELVGPLNIKFMTNKKKVHQSYQYQDLIHYLLLIFFSEFKSEIVIVMKYSSARQCYQHHNWIN